MQCLRSSLAGRPAAFQAAVAGGRPAAFVRVRRGVTVQAMFASTKTKEGGIYGFEVDDIDGKPVSLSKYKGKVLLVVNLASQCGFTPQYAELQALHDKFSSRGLTILGFPCNQFGQQEPGSNASIKRFAQQTYGVKFPLFAKVDVNGNNADPLFDYLKNEKGGFLTKDIKWNFTKFLVNKEGKVVGRYGSTDAPSQIEKDIARLL